MGALETVGHAGSLSASLKTADRAQADRAQADRAQINFDRRPLMLPCSLRRNSGSAVQCAGQASSKACPCEFCGFATCSCRRLGVFLAAAYPDCLVVLQGGDFTHGNGMGGESIYGAKFPVRPAVLCWSLGILMEEVTGGKGGASSGQ